uniref:Uncharacterized protein n=1 Tax=Tanacetum cinerariifolium TaxID=118510 RepID=A0A699UFF3_TANCI|nr:hypothetical protein [Tanacetum cinerariifolium]
MGEDNHGFRYGSLENPEWLRLNLGYCRPIDQVGTFSTNEDDGQYGETHSAIPERNCLSEWSANINHIGQG